MRRSGRARRCVLLGTLLTHGRSFVGEVRRRKRAARACGFLIQGIPPPSTLFTYSGGSLFFKSLYHTYGRTRFNEPFRVLELLK